MSFLTEIWCEGNARLGHTACHLGYGKGETFREVCEDWASRNPYFDNHWNRRFMTYWGDKLYNNEAEAREKLG